MMVACCLKTLGDNDSGVFFFKLDSAECKFTCWQHALDTRCCFFLAFELNKKVRHWTLGVIIEFSPFYCAAFCCVSSLSHRRPLDEPRASKCDFEGNAKVKGRGGRLQMVGIGLGAQRQMLPAHTQTQHDRCYRGARRQ